MNVLEFTGVNVLHLVVGNYSRCVLVRDLIQEMGTILKHRSRHKEEQAPLTSQRKRLDTKHKKHWAWKGRELVVRGSSVVNKATRMKFKCP
jgi:hypothetical protein